ncbi:unnamed protein product [Medioppia subpectinata]|uniref:Uncharacterized protein n=1 Tax=Medioppia subpectinata TaxID=1979941 RepID=A0A7R9KBT8_9ACAR|nr:unnamed protein product [Medioppia subpectinata]CAG2100506.1 unnamed protein product [Medioppia subpectinata]
MQFDYLFEYQIFIRDFGQNVTKFTFDSNENAFLLCEKYSQNESLVDEKTVFWPKYQLFVEFDKNSSKALKFRIRLNGKQFSPYFSIPSIGSRETKYEFKSAFFWRKTNKILVLAKNETKIAIFDFKGTETRILSLRFQDLFGCWKREKTFWELHGKRLVMTMAAAVWLSFLLALCGYKYAEFRFEFGANSALC